MTKNQPIRLRTTFFINLQWATKVAETLKENDTFLCSILFASSLNHLIPLAPQFNVV